MFQRSSEILDARLPRRRLLRHFVIGTAFSAVMGRQWCTTLIADCLPVQAGAGILRINLSDFPALQSDQGSVRLALNPFVATSTSVTPFYPVLINRGEGAQFFALSSRCTHQGCVVAGYDASEGASVCPCHGSVFGIDGRRISGPAGSSLTKYRVSFDGVDGLCVEIPGSGFSVTSTAVANAASSRLRLQFPTKRNVIYEIRFRRSVSDTSAIVSFASTEDGQLTNTVISTTTNSTVTVYVDRTEEAGFYSVAMQVTEA